MPPIIQRMERASQMALPTSSSASQQKLQELLQNPIKFVSATHLTYDNEAKMAPELRFRKVRDETNSQCAERQNVSFKVD